jgi:trans-2,3-dihydro-3-hydroxyanthranilate isomerase
MTASLKFRIVNSCAPRPFAGNPICVMLDEPDPALMQSIARQMNLACTVFPKRTGEDTYRMRLFTPEREVAYAGSPSLAAAWIMGQGRWIQTTSGAVAVIDVAGDVAWMEQPEPQLSDIDDDDVLRGIGLKRAERIFACQVASNRFVVAVTEEDPVGFTPRMDVLMGPATRHGGPALVGAVRKVNEGELHARFFGPAHGVPEDPACGAVAGALGAIMHRFFGTASTISLRQGEEIGHPSRISVSIENGRIAMGGRLVAMAEGAFNIQ